MHESDSWDGKGMLKVLNIDTKRGFTTMGAPPGGPKPQGAVGPEKKKRPSIIFLILDFLVFGGAITAMVLLFLSN